jgi:hypothetical protein
MNRRTTPYPLLKRKKHDREAWMGHPTPEGFVTNKKLHVLNARGRSSTILDSAVKSVRKLSSRCGAAT